MSIVPVRNLSVSDLSLLGNNVVPALRADQRSGIDRSLAAHGEEVHWFDHRPVTSRETPKATTPRQRVR